jgi:hypothetical protein
VLQYCLKHMRSHGQLPVRPVCEVQGCDKYARPAEEPGAPRRFCLTHMQLNGVTPRTLGQQCQQQGMRAAADAGAS